MTTKENITLEDFEQFISLPENADRLFELIDGKVFEKMPTQLHAYIVAVFIAALMNYLRGNPIGWALVEARYRLPDDQENDLIPDFSFVLSAGKQLVREGPAPYMPDIVGEVQSPGQSRGFMIGKANTYLLNGARMVWLIYPDERIVEVVTRSSDGRITTIEKLNETDVINGGSVLPDFKLPVRDLFAV